MSEGKHTPGPWHANTPADEHYAKGSTIRDTEGDIVAVVHACNRGSTIANARLIAQAPALLAERDALRAEVARLREAAEVWLRVIEGEDLDERFDGEATILREALAEGEPDGR